MSPGLNQPFRCWVLAHVGTGTGQQTPVCFSLLNKSFVITGPQLENTGGTGKKSYSFPPPHITKSKLIPLARQQSINLVTRCWRKEKWLHWESQQAEELEDRSLKEPAWETITFRLLLCRERGNWRGIRSGVNDENRRLEPARVRRGWWDVFALHQQIDCGRPGHSAPRSILIRNHYFCTYFPYLLRDVVLGRQVVSIMSRLQVRSF